MGVNHKYSIVFLFGNNGTCYLRPCGVWCFKQVWRILMQIELNGKSVNISPQAFAVIPVQWMFNPEMTDGDFTKLCKLWWRYSFLANKALERDPNTDLRYCFHPAQSTLCDLLGFTEKSRPKVSLYLAKMERLGYIKRVKETVMVEGKPTPRHYIQVVNDNVVFRRTR